MAFTLGHSESRRVANSRLRRTVEARLRCGRWSWKSSGVLLWSALMQSARFQKPTRCKLHKQEARAPIPQAPNPMIGRIQTSGNQRHVSSWREVWEEIHSRMALYRSILSAWVTGPGEWFRHARRNWQRFGAAGCTRCQHRVSKQPRSKRWKLPRKTCERAVTYLSPD